jgi:choline dehydrogenase
VYDYVIIGAGSAGCTLAGRLSADPGRRVLLLEAGGGDRRPSVKIPAAFSHLFHTSADWDFACAPEAQFDGRRLYVPRGRLVGGSSSINAMIYVRGHRLDYDGWAATGCAGWSYAEVLPCFRRAEGQARGSDAFHGALGPLRVTDLDRPNPLSLAFVDAAAAAGYPRNPDFNGAHQTGFGQYQVTQRRGRRWSAADAYLRPARRRPNRTLRTGVQVIRILFAGRRAVGVEYRRRGRLATAAVRGEVLLAAGAIQSPQLLMLSGVGPAAELARHGIGLVHDLPGVGRNLQDHPVVPILFATTGVETLRRADAAVNVARFLLARRGPLTSNVAEAGGFVRSRPELPAPDLQFHFAPVLFEHHTLRDDDDGFALGATLVAPRSRGHVALASADPLVPPAIVSNQLSDRHDMDTLVEGVRIARRIAAQEPFAPYRRKELEPGPEITTAKEIEAYLRSHVELLYHPAGTCRMGVDEAAVVDPRLRVHGLDGLRVVDASIMPLIVRGNTHAPTVMIAERAVDLLRAV